MRKALAIATVLALATMVLAAVPMKVNAAQVTKITPSKGKVGQTAIVHGSGFKGATVAVIFGRNPAEEVEVLNDKIIKLTVPTRHALDFNPVKVAVTVDEVFAGDLWFIYDAAGPEPVITGFDPPFAKVGTAPRVTIRGDDFTTPPIRAPVQVFIGGPESIAGIIDISSVTATSFAVDFPLVMIPGDYLIVVGFSDGSGVTAEGFEIIP